VLAVLLVALSLGLSNFAAAVGMGVGGVSGRTRLRVGVIFGLFEGGMPILGLLLGHSLAGVLGHAARWIGASLLIATGVYALIQAVRGGGSGHPGVADGGQRTGRLLVTGLALSIDNLAVGFALGAYHVSLILAAVVIGAVSVALSLIGLELGSRLGARIGERGEVIGGLVLIGVGAAIAAGALLGEGGDGAGVVDAVVGPAPWGRVHDRASAERRHHSGATDGAGVTMTEELASGACAPSYVP
jgi:manganese efflux pump family protein